MENKIRALYALGIVVSEIVFKTIYFKTFFSDRVTYLENKSERF